MKKKISRALMAVRLWIRQTVEYCCQHPFQIVAWIIFSFLVVGAIITLMIWIVGLMDQAAAAIGAFFDKYFRTLVAVGLGVWGLADWLEKRRQKREEWKQAEEARREAKRQEAIREKAHTAEATYKMMAKVVYEIARGLGPSGIVPPNRLSDIYSPNHMVPIGSGEVMLGLYLLPKSRDDVDTDLLKMRIKG